MKENNDSSLATFVFDDEDEFNFSATNIIPTDKSKAIDNSKLPADFDKEEEGEEKAPTNLEQARKEKPEKEKAPVVKQEKKDEEEEELEEAKKRKRKSQEELVESVEEALEEDFDFGEDKTKPKSNGKEKEKEEGEKEATAEKFYTNLALDLKDRGTLSIDIDEERDYSIEEFFELQETEIETRFNETIEAFREEFDEDGKEFLRWKKGGGSTKDFITQYLAPSFNLINFDDENQSHVDRTIDFYLKTVEGLEDEELAERRGYIKDSGKEKTYAKNFFKKLEKVDSERKEVLQQDLEKRAKKEQEEEDKFNGELIETLEEIKGLGSFSISDTDRKGLGGYVTKPAIKVGKNRYIPKFQHDLRNILVANTKENKRRLLVLAKIVANDFNLKDLEQKVETKVTKGAKARISSSTPQGVTGSGNRRPQLADFIED